MNDFNDQDHPLIARLEQAWGYATHRKAAIASTVIGTAAVLTLQYFLGGPFISLALLAVVAVITARALGKQQTIAFAKKRWYLVAPVTLAALIFLKPALMFYVSWMNTDWERTLDPPTVYYIWNVNKEGFSSDDKKRLEHLNPSKEQNTGMRSNILVAASAVGINADRLAPFDPSLLKDHSRFTVIVFESISSEVPQLIVYFISPVKEPDKLEDGKEPRFNMVPMAVPATLDITLGFLATGLSRSTGEPISEKFLKEFLQRQQQLQEQTGPPEKG